MKLGPILIRHHTSQLLAGRGQLFRWFDWSRSALQDLGSQEAEPHSGIGWTWDGGFVWSKREMRQANAVETRARGRRLRSLHL
jgi:hypothetical protein